MQMDHGGIGVKTIIRSNIFLSLKQNVKILIILQKVLSINTNYN